MKLTNVRNLNIAILNCYHRIRVDPVYNCDARDADGLIYYINGAQRFAFADTAIVGTEGAMVYLPYGSKYQNFVNRPETEYYQVDFIVYKNGAPAPLFGSPRCFEKGDIPDCRELIMQIRSDYVTMDDSRTFSCFSNLCKLIDIVGTQKADADQSALIRINNSVQYIHEFYNRNTSMRTIAAMSSTCVSNLERLFKQYFGVPPCEYRTMLRINRAKQLLLAGLTIEETASEVGFYDSFHFSKTFKKFTGVPPGEYARSGRIK